MRKNPRDTLTVIILVLVSLSYVFACWARFLGVVYELPVLVLLYVVLEHWLCHLNAYLYTR